MIKCLENLDSILMLNCSETIAASTCDHSIYIVFAACNGILFAIAMAVAIILAVFLYSDYFSYNKKKKYYEEASEQVYDLVYKDRLTGLRNRVWVDDCLERQMTGKQYAILMMDIDNFKYVNDTFGHWAGNEVLKQVAKRLSRLIQEEDVISRTGGDEVMFVLPGCSKENVIRMAQNIMSEIEKQFLLNNITYDTTASIGISFCPQDGKCVAEVMKAADTALNVAKQAGKRRYVFFDQKMQKSMKIKMELEDGLRKAVERKEFVLYYQPQYCVNTGKLYGFEALIRWNHPKLGILMPNQFIKIAEESGLIIPIGRWVVGEAARFIKKLEENGYYDFTVSVNASVCQIVEDHYSEFVLDTIQKYQLKPESIKIEITESILLDGKKNENIEQIEQISSKGVNICLDDFGTGYSSITYLQKLPISILKIDKSFVDYILTKPQEANICEHIIQLAHSIELKVVAEGVETQGQYDWLKEKKCDFIQGFVAGRPMSEQTLMDRLDTIMFYRTKESD